MGLDSGGLSGCLVSGPGALLVQQTSPGFPSGGGSERGQNASGGQASELARHHLYCILIYKSKSRRLSQCKACRNRHHLLMEKAAESHLGGRQSLWPG